MAVSVHVPVPLFMVTIPVAKPGDWVSPLTVHTPAVPRIDGVLPSLVVAVTVNGLAPVGLYGAVAGAPVKLAEGGTASAAILSSGADPCW